MHKREMKNLRSLDEVAFTEGEVVRNYKISSSALRKGRMDGLRKGKMPPPPFVRVGRKILYLKSDLDNWLLAHRVEVKPKV